MKLEGWHFVIVIALALLLFGAPRLPGLARSAGQSLRIFRSEVRQMKDENPAPSPAAAAPAASPVPDYPVPASPVPSPAPVVPTAAAPVQNPVQDSAPGHGPAQNGHISGT